MYHDYYFISFHFCENWIISDCYNKSWEGVIYSGWRFNSCESVPREASIFREKIQRRFNDRPIWTGRGKWMIHWMCIPSNWIHKWWRVTLSQRYLLLSFYKSSYRPADYWMKIIYTLLSNILKNDKDDLYSVWGSQMKFSFGASFQLRIACAIKVVQGPPRSEKIPRILRDIQVILII